MLAGIMQIRSPSGSNGLYIPKINPGMKKTACIIASCEWVVGSNYYTLNYYILKYNLSFLRLAFTVGNGDTQLHAEIIVVVFAARRGLHGYLILIGKE